uniref:Large ribosomal subunit protein bL33m n=1 Tax=Cacopsylla melanoneura TaxID=428564 RepID=A0A8D8UGC9_9HEMI
MHLTPTLLAKSKSKHALVMLKSVMSGRKLYLFKERNPEKLEVLHYDPHIDTDTIYQEVKRIRSAELPSYTPFPGYTKGYKKVYDNAPDVYIPTLKNKLD